MTLTLSVLLIYLYHCIQFSSSTTPPADHPLINENSRCEFRTLHRSFSAPIGLCSQTRIPPTIVHHPPPSSWAGEKQRYLLILNNNERHWLKWGLYLCLLLRSLSFRDFFFFFFGWGNRLRCPSKANAAFIIQYHNEALVFTN